MGLFGLRLQNLHILLYSTFLLIGHSLVGDYSVISSSDYCGHVQGGYPARCYKVESHCEEHCTAFSWCIGYSYDEINSCALMTSTDSCSNGWTFHSGNTAAKSSDLEPSPSAFYSGYNCMAKGIAKNLIYSFKIYAIIHLFIAICKYYIFLLTIKLARASHNFGKDTMTCFADHAQPWSM